LKKRSKKLLSLGVAAVNPNGVGRNGDSKEPHVKIPILASLALGAALLAAIGPARAQDAVRIRGAIVAINGSTLDLTTRDGSKLSATLAPNVGVAAVSIARIEDIKPDSYIGTAAVPQPDGTLKALEVHVFAASMRGTGDGHRPWDSPGATNTMTNGTVGSVVGSTGRTLHITYKGGEKDVVVPPDVPIVSLEPGARDLLVAGAKVIAFGTRAADGQVTIERISVGTHGIAPPM